jgi:hypothetical protein
MTNPDCEECDGTGATEHPQGPPGNREIACESCHQWTCEAAIQLLRDIRENGFTASQDRSIAERMRAILA